MLFELAGRTVDLKLYKFQNLLDLSSNWKLSMTQLVQKRK